MDTKANFQMKKMNENVANTGSRGENSSPPNPLQILSVDRSTALFIALLVLDLISFKNTYSMREEKILN